MLDLCLLGTSGMMPLPGRALTALMARFGGSSLLIDCGEGTQVAIRERGWSFHPIDTICFTHYHGDHISGLPGLLLSMGNAERKEPVTLIGPRGLQKVVESLLVIAQGLPFELQYIELTDKEQDLECNGYHLHAFRVNHNVTCYGYTIEIPRSGRFFPERAKEQGIPVQYWNRLQHGETVESPEGIYTPDMVLGAPRKGLKVTYCTDTRPTAGLTKNASMSDLLICEGMYGDKEKKAKAIENKHMMFLEAAQTAKEAEVKELWLTLYSPSLLYPQNYMREVCKIFPNAVAGKDGMSCTLEFED